MITYIIILVILVAVVGILAGYSARDTDKINIFIGVFIVIVVTLLWNVVVFVGSKYSSMDIRQHMVVRYDDSCYHNVDEILYRLGEDTVSYNRINEIENE